MAEPVAGTLEILPIAGLPELRPGDDLAGLICRAAPWLRDGDILVVTSKALSKVEGRLLAVPTDPEGRERARQDAITAETVRVVAQRGATKIVATHHGWVMAAAGVDASNVARGELALLPLDADASARALREAIVDRVGVRVAVVISDTNGRAWRRGLTDIAIGVAGMGALADLRGQLDTSGVPLEVTEIAVADEVAAAADLVKGKLAGVPAAILRGLLPPVDDGHGSASLRRPLAEDMFALGTRDVVGTRRAPTGFAPRPVPVPVLRGAIETALRATGLLEGLELLAELVAEPATPAGGKVAQSPAGRLLEQATAVIAPVLPEPSDAVTLTRLGMAIAALLIQLHAEGLAAAWLSPAELDDADVDGELANRIVGRLPEGVRTHGVVLVGHHPGNRIDQIER
ncbi:MAG: coenzyme F420-0:L-glutamate ligase [Actinomycetota bacterium]|nr:coenzyme F420-0:L-glutamate ligase [Actinomycetota bacterium]